MLYTRVVTKVALNTQRKSISTTVRKEPKTYGLIHHFLKRLKLILQNHSSDYWTNIFQKSNSLYKIFYRNTIKVSYSCVNNVSQIIKQHNKNVAFKKEKQTNSCNCRNKNECPLNGNCKVQNVIYKCTVSAIQTFKQRVYLGIAEGNWKQRLYNVIFERFSKTRSIRTTQHYQVISGI